MKRLVLTIILLGCNNLWGLKEWKKWSVYIISECEFYGYYDDECKSKIPTLPNDYKPTKEDKVLKVKVGNVEGEIVGVRKNDRSRTWFIRSNRGDYKYIGSLFDGKDILINYPNYTIMAHIWIIESEVNLGFYQIFQVGNELKIFWLDNVVTLCEKNADSCPNPLDYFKNLSTQDILKKIEELGGEKYFDYACPKYHSADLESECLDGFLND